MGALVVETMHLVAALCEKMRSFKVMFFWSFDGIFIGFQGDFIGLIFFLAG